MASYLVTQSDLKSSPLIELLNRIALRCQGFLAQIFSFSPEPQINIDLVVSAIFRKRYGLVSGKVYSPILLSTVDESSSEIILDYGRCEGGVPVFEISTAASESETVEFDVVYSETREGIDNEQGVQNPIDTTSDANNDR